MNSNECNKKELKELLDTFTCSIYTIVPSENIVYLEVKNSKGEIFNAECETKIIKQWGQFNTGDSFLLRCYKNNNSNVYFEAEHIPSTKMSQEDSLLLKKELDEIFDVFNKRP